MIAHDLITGNRVEQVKADMANRTPPSTEPPNYHITRADISFPGIAHPVVPIEKPEHTELHDALTRASEPEPMRDEYGSRYSQVDKEIEAREQAFEKNQEEYTAYANAMNASKEAPSSEAQADNVHAEGEEGGQGDGGKGDGA
jgi:hypothetical protein